MKKESRLFIAGGIIYLAGAIIFILSAVTSAFGQQSPSPVWRSSPAIAQQVADAGEESHYEVMTLYSSQAEPVAPEAVKQAAENTCRVRVRFNQGGRDFTDWGSGCLVKTDRPGHYYVITAAHVVEQAGGGESVEVEFWNGEKFIGAVVGEDRGADTATVKLRGGPTLPGAEFRACGCDPAVGEQVFFLGYAQITNLTYRSGTVRSVNGRAIMASGNSIDGMSGGPVFDIKGRLLGDLFGTDDVNTFFARPSEVLRINRNLFAAPNAGEA